MRSRSCHVVVLLALLSACETVPENVKVDVDGHSLEIKRKPAEAQAKADEPR